MLLAAFVATPEAAASFVHVGGRAMRYECAGSGAPTVVLDAGSPGGTESWRWVQPELARFTRVCSYDRLGNGASARPAAGRRTPRMQADELHELLRHARIPGPYVVVGHSWGGLIAQIYTHAYPAEVAGAVLLDPTNFAYGIPPLRKVSREGIDVRAAAAELAAVHSLGAIPLVVLGSTNTATDKTFLKAQDAAARLSTDSVDAIARHSTHDIPSPAPKGQPGLVVDSVRAVVGALRRRGRLPPCGTVFPAGSVLCR